MSHTLARKYLRDKWPEFDEALDSLSIPARLQSSDDMQLLVLYGGFGFLPAASDRKLVCASELSQTASDVSHRDAADARTLVASVAILAGCLLSAARR